MMLKQDDFLNPPEIKKVGKSFEIDEFHILINGKRIGKLAI